MFIIGPQLDLPKATLKKFHRDLTVVSYFVLVEWLAWLDTPQSVIARVGIIQLILEPESMNTGSVFPTYCKRWLKGGHWNCGLDLEI